MRVTLYCYKCLAWAVTRREYLPHRVELLLFGWRIYDKMDSDTCWECIGR